MPVFAAPGRSDVPLTPPPLRPIPADWLPPPLEGTRRVDPEGEGRCDAQRHQAARARAPVRISTAQLCREREAGGGDGERRKGQRVAAWDKNRLAPGRDREARSTRMRQGQPLGRGVRPGSMHREGRWHVVGGFGGVGQLTFHTCWPVCDQGALGIPNDDSPRKVLLDRDSIREQELDLVVRHGGPSPPFGTLTGCVETFKLLKPLPLPDEVESEATGSRNQGFSSCTSLVDAPESRTGETSSLSSVPVFPAPRWHNGG